MNGYRTILLTGCPPEPLMNYLKALGVLRIVAEQSDPRAKGSWAPSAFRLDSRHDRVGLVDFFASQYCPTPVLAPWNGDGGFVTEAGTSHDTLERILESTSPALARLKTVIDAVRDVPTLRDFRKSRDTVKDLENQKKVLKKQRRTLSDEDQERLRWAKARVEELKNRILVSVRSDLPDEVIRWLDACVTVLPDGFRPSPLLGTGGCDGRLEFSANFLANLLLVSEASPTQRQGWVEDALFGDVRTQLVETAIGQFAPGRAGGPNLTQGFEGPSIVNPFDFILMIEGSLILSGAASRRYDADPHAKAAFPFTVSGSAAGSGTVSEEETRGSRGEVWLPLWTRPATLGEVSFVFGEGRAEVRGRRARSATDFARAIASLGVDRGLSGFVRYSFLPRNGRNFLATPLGRFEVTARPHVDLIREVDPWMDTFQRAASQDQAPPRFRRAWLRIENAIFECCRQGGPGRFGDILRALGRAERELAIAERFRDEHRLRPIAGLSQDWILAACDGSVEFDLALSLASVFDPGHKVGPLRTNLEPVTVGGSRDGRLWAAWAEEGRAVVWNASDLSLNLASVLERRLMQGRGANSDHLPIAAGHTVSLDAIAAFLEGEVDDRKIEELLWGFLLVDQSRPPPPSLSRRRCETAPPLDRRYALLKLLFSPEPLRWKNEMISVRPEGAILALLRSGRVGEACALARRRLRASGLVPMPHRPLLARNQDRDVGEMPVAKSTRLAAALLFPVSSFDVDRLLRLVLWEETPAEGWNVSLQGGT